VFALARGAYMTVAVPLSHRGRGLSMMGGANRLGLLIGPFVAAVVVQHTGSVRNAWIITVVASIAIALTLLLWSGDEKVNYNAESDPSEEDSKPSGILATFTKRSDVLVRVGLAAGLINTMRTSRQVLVPLIGVALGLSAVTITTFVGICAIVDFVLFYFGGQLMDRFGRLWVAVPTMLVFGAAHLVFALVTDLPDPFVWYVGASVFLSIGNGLTSGIVATMGSDLADQRSPAAFLGSWRLVTQIGPAGAPVVIAALTGVYSIAVASFAMAGTSLVGALVLLRYLPRYLPRLPRRRH
jgi:MFS family permease